MQAFVIHT